MKFVEKGKRRRQLKDISPLSNIKKDFSMLLNADKKNIIIRSIQLTYSNYGKAENVLLTWFC